MASKYIYLHWTPMLSCLQVAQQFAGPGIVFKIDVHNAKDIQPFSCYGNMEGELLLSPNMVSSAPTSSL